MYMDKNGKEREREREKYNERYFCETYSVLKHVASIKIVSYNQTPKTLSAFNLKAKKVEIRQCLLR